MTVLSTNDAPPSQSQPRTRRDTLSPTAQGHAAETTIAKLKTERDRYVALAFAAGDMLLEVGIDRRIRTVSGACQNLCGRAPAEILDTDVRDLADLSDRAFMHRVLDCLTIMGRVDPVPIRLAYNSGANQRALMGACQLPTFQDRIFMSLTLLPSMAASDAPRDEETGLLTKDAMLETARASATDPNGPKRQLSLIRLDGLGPAKNGLPRERAQVLMQEIGAVMRAASLGGNAAGRLGDEEFGVVRGGNETINHLPGAIGKISRESGLAADAFSTQIANLDLSVGKLSDADAVRTLAYAVKAFLENDGVDFSLSSLAEGLPAAMERTVSRFSSLTKVIETGELQLVFQPIVSMKNRVIHHYEVLSRFPDGHSPYDTIAFSEEVGLIEYLDLAVLKKSFAQILGATGPKIAVNISGRSIQSPSFRTALEHLVKTRKSVASRIFFELTESIAIEQLDEAANFLQWLRGQGHKVCLDDFGAGAAAYSYLRHFDVDFVKIDGAFLKAGIAHPRERALIASICRLCADLGSATIGEMIEIEAEAVEAAAIGIEFGQGWLFGRPVPHLPGGLPVGSGWLPPAEKQT